MTRALSVDDLDWAVAVLARRRDALVTQAPIFWRPAPHSVQHHRLFLEHLLISGGACGYRTEHSWTWWLTGARRQASVALSSSELVRPRDGPR